MEQVHYFTNNLHFTKLFLQIGRFFYLKYQIICEYGEVTSFDALI